MNPLGPCSSLATLLLHGQVLLHEPASVLDPANANKTFQRQPRGALSCYGVSYGGPTYSPPHHGCGSGLASQFVGAQSGNDPAAVGNQVRALRRAEMHHVTTLGGEALIGC